MHRNFKFFVLSLLVLFLVSGCAGEDKKPLSAEEIAEAEFQAFEAKAIETAKEFVLATQGDREKIKELSFFTLLDDLEAKNWSIMLVDGISIDPDSLETSTEKIGDRQVFVRVFYEGLMEFEGDVLPVKLSSKLGLIKQDEQALVFVID